MTRLQSWDPPTPSPGLMVCAIRGVLVRPWLVSMLGWTPGLISPPDSELDQQNHLIQKWSKKYSNPVCLTDSLRINRHGFLSCRLWYCISWCATLLHVVLSAVECTKFQFQELFQLMNHSHESTVDTFCSRPSNGETTRTQSHWCRLPQATTRVPRPTSWSPRIQMPGCHKST